MVGNLGRAPRAHIIVQNLPVPFDRRVWLECQSLTSAGYEVSVVCPKGPGDPACEVVDSVTIYKYNPPKTGSGKAAFLREYVHSFAATAWLTARAWRRHRFDVLQACNPPDIFWPIALVLRLFGVRFVFDHHDLCPELYESKFGTRRSPFYRGLRVLEWCTFRVADQVTSTNDSYRAIAIDRGGKRPGDVTVVRTGPDPNRLRAGEPNPALRRGREHLAVYLGVMGPQDGVDLAVRAAGLVVHRLGRTDISFTFIGGGESYDDVVTLVRELELDEYVSMPGRLPDAEVAALLSSADVGLCPDPKNPLNDVSTMNKTMEYMAFGLPVVAFDLWETRVSAADAAVYAKPNEVADYCRLLLQVVDDAPLRAEMGARGRRRVVDSLAWSHQAERFVGVYDGLVGRPSRATGVAITVAG
ncbi:MAG: glycosyltransferase family 4 protein [Acidimicrobiaceae bacterium]|nr:glycosyltransferase family 4 protein [Acidimicrobiaceae bacterium]